MGTHGIFTLRCPLLGHHRTELMTPESHHRKYLGGAGRGIIKYTGFKYLDYQIDGPNPALPSPVSLHWDDGSTGRLR